MARLRLLGFIILTIFLYGCTDSTFDKASSSNYRGEAILTFDKILNGTSTDTVATPSDFPKEYNYGSGKMSDWNRVNMVKRLPEPKGDETVLTASIKPSDFQAFYLWENGNMPSRTKFTRDMVGYFDPYDFRPYLTSIPLPDGVQAKGAVILLAGGAYQFRGNYTDALTTAAALRENGFKTFVLDYRLRPYTQEEGALDVARAVRFVKKNAENFGIDENNIAVMGFSAGGIQAGEFLMHYDDEVDGSVLDSSYVPDELDKVSAEVAADGMIYAFYGRLSVGNMDPAWLKSGNLPPTFYAYGTRDPFFQQFEQQYQVLKQIGVPVSRVVLRDWPHGFGSDGGWINDYVSFLESAFNSDDK